MVLQEKVLRKTGEEIKFAFIDDTMESFTHRFLKRQKAIKLLALGPRSQQQNAARTESTLKQAEATA